MQRPETSSDAIGRLLPFLPILLLLVCPPPPGLAQDPAWLGTVSSLPLQTAPFEEMLAADGLARMRVEQGQAYRFHADGVHAYLLEDGRVMDRSSAAAGGWVYLYPSHVECDEMVFEAQRETTLKVEAGEMRDVEAAAGEAVEIPLEPGGDLVMRFIGLDEGPSTCIYQFFKGGEDVSLAPEEYRTTTLSGSDEPFQQTFQADADLLVVKVTEGHMQVKAGQPFGD